METTTTSTDATMQTKASPISHQMEQSWNSGNHWRILVQLLKARRTLDEIIANAESVKVMFDEHCHMLLDILQGLNMLLNPTSPSHRHFNTCHPDMMILESDLLLSCLKLLHQFWTIKRYRSKLVTGQLAEHVTAVCELVKSLMIQSQNAHKHIRQAMRQLPILLEDLLAILALTKQDTCPLIGHLVQYATWKDGKLFELLLVNCLRIAVLFISAPLHWWQDAAGPQGKHHFANSVYRRAINSGGTEADQITIRDLHRRFLKLFFNLQSSLLRAMDQNPEMVKRFCRAKEVVFEIFFMFEFYENPKHDQICPRSEYDNLLILSERILNKLVQQRGVQIEYDMEHVCNYLHLSEVKLKYTLFGRCLDALTMHLYPGESDPFLDQIPFRLPVGENALSDSLDSLESLPHDEEAMEAEGEEVEPEPPLNYSEIEALYSDLDKLSFELHKDAIGKLIRVNDAAFWCFDPTRDPLPLEELAPKAFRAVSEYVSTALSLEGAFKVESDLKNIELDHRYSKRPEPVPEQILVEGGFRSQRDQQVTGTLSEKASFKDDYLLKYQKNTEPIDLEDNPDTSSLATSHKRPNSWPSDESHHQTQIENPGSAPRMQSQKRIKLAQTKHLYQALVALNKGSKDA